LHYTVYKVTNTLNKRYYIGKHQTKDLNDSYYGSGIALQRAIKKHGKAVFKKEILFVYDNEREMNAKERELVSEAVLQDPLSYNMGLGGEGGPLFKNKKHSPASIAQRTKARAGFTYKKTKEQLNRERKSRYLKNGGSWFSTSTIEKIRLKALQRNADWSSSSSPRS
jgi:hypothetical protein